MSTPPASAASRASEGAVAAEGLAFLGIELYEFAHLLHEGAGPQRSAFLSSFFALVGTHGLHVFFGCIWLIVLMTQAPPPAANFLIFPTMV